MKIARKTGCVNEMREHIRHFTVTPRGIEQFEQADIGFEEVQVKMSGIPGGKCIREISLRHMPA